MAESKKITELNSISVIDGNYYFVVDNGTSAFKFNYSDLQINAATPSLEAVYDAIAAAITPGTGISVSSSDPGNTTTISSTITQYTDEMARDALGLALTSGTGITITPNDGADTITIASSITQYAAENARDDVGAALVSGAGITITVNDPSDTITITSIYAATPITGSYTDEQARDAIGAALVAGSGITIAVDDPNNTITIGSQYAATPMDEAIRDVIGATLIQGTGMTITVNDAANTITLASSGSYTAENARDDVGAALVAGGGISINVNDPSDTITISSIYAATPLGQSSTPNLKTAFYSAGWPARPFSETTLWVSSDRAATPPTAALNTDIVILPPPLEVWEFALSDETTAISSTGTKLTWRTPAAITLTSARASLSTAATPGTMTINIKETGVTIFSTKLTITANQKTSLTAATPYVFSDTTLADDAEIAFDVDVTGTGGKGLKVKLYGYRT